MSNRALAFARTPWARGRVKQLDKHLLTCVITSVHAHPHNFQRSEVVLPGITAAQAYLLALKALLSADTPGPTMRVMLDSRTVAVISANGRVWVAGPDDPLQTFDLLLLEAP